MLQLRAVAKPIHVNTTSFNLESILIFRKIKTYTSFWSAKIYCILTKFYLIQLKKIDDLQNLINPF